MTKNKWESMKSLGSHIDPEKEEELRGTKLVIDEQVPKIMKLIRSKQRGKEANSRRDSELIQFIQDFHKQYQSLYALYDNLRGEVREKIDGNDEKERSSSSSSSSNTDSESYYSPDETGSKSSGSESEPKKVREKFRQKLENSYSEVADLKNKLLSVNEEKETLNLEYITSLSKIQESEKIIEGLKFEAEKTESSRRKLLDECGELKRQLSKKENELLSDLTKKFEDNENNLKSKIEDLMAKSTTMKVELDSLRTQKGELEKRLLSKSNEESAQAKGVVDQVNVLQQELKSLTSQKSESESHLEKQTQEISDFLTEIEVLKEKLESKTLDEQITIEEKESLKLELDSLRAHKSELEKQIREKNHESDQLSVEHNGLHVKILDMEKLIMERGNEFSALQNKLEGSENNASTEIKNLRKDLDFLQTEKNQLERQKKVSLESLSQTEKKNTALSSKTADLERIVKEQDGIIKKLNEDIKQEKGKLLDSKLNLQIAEKKSEEMAEEFRKKFEDNLRLLSRRIRVAEQLHVETKDFYRKTKEKYELEHGDLKERFTNNEVALRKVKDISLTANDLLGGLDAVALKFEECSGNFLNRISKFSCELKFAKDWVRRKNNAIKHVKEDVDCLLAQLDVKEAEILGYREKVWKLENKARELEKTVKEREEGMLGLGEEKREAIRQLCVWIDYHRSRSDYLKKMLSEMRIRSQRTT